MEQDKNEGHRLPILPDMNWQDITDLVVSGIIHPDQTEKETLTKMAALVQMNKACGLAMKNPTLKEEILALIQKAEKNTLTVNGVKFTKTSTSSTSYEACEDPLLADLELAMAKIKEAITERKKYLDGIPKGIQIDRNQTNEDGTPVTFVGMDALIPATINIADTVIQGYTLPVISWEQGDEFKRLKPVSKIKGDNYSCTPLKKK